MYKCSCVPLTSQDLTVYFFLLLANLKGGWYFSWERQGLGLATASRVPHCQPSTKPELFIFDVAEAVLIGHGTRELRSRKSSRRRY
jgi:hypothetical protein